MKLFDYIFAVDETYLFLSYKADWEIVLRTEKTNLKPLQIIIHGT